MASRTVLAAQVRVVRVALGAAAAVETRLLQWVSLVAAAVAVPDRVRPAVVVLAQPWVVTVVLWASQSLVLREAVAVVRVRRALALAMILMLSDSSLGMVASPVRAVDAVV